MTTVLGRNTNQPLKITSGTILSLKATVPLPYQSRFFAHFGPLNLNLFNENDDILLYISFSGAKITFMDRAHRSIGDGWGEAQTVDIKHMDSMKGRSVHNVTVSIYYYLTDSELGRYQILLNGTTICHFNQRLPGPAIRISYLRDMGEQLAPSSWSPSSWAVDVFQVDDLLPEERGALVPGR